ncbi:hypothetical protein VTN96DRAFT_9350 [Rasamsonia emersonii]
MASSDIRLPLHPPVHEQDPGAEFRDPKRIRLIEEFENSLKECLDDTRIPCTAWAFLWLCDVDKLEEHLQGPDVFYFYSPLHAVDSVGRPVELCPSQTYDKRCL